ncbi:MAG: DUF4136 domain-containing protein [Pseudomonadota bacterium]|nr:DUF4136 domain-containing protein [Pseudomonadota bacterium]
MTHIAHRATKPTVTLFVLVGILLGLNACATRYPVATDYDDRFAFSGKTSFALVAPEDIQTAENDLVKSRIEKALRQQLQAQGFQETDREQADIWISYFATTEKQQDILTYDRYNTYYGYTRCYRCYYPAAPMWTTDVEVVNYTAGTLIIDVIDPASNTLKWRGSTTSRVTTSRAEKMTVEERTERVNQAVAAILANYPPAKTHPE